MKSNGSNLGSSGGVHKLIDSGNIDKRQVCYAVGVNSRVAGGKGLHSLTTGESGLGLQCESAECSSGQPCPGRGLEAALEEG